ncbi:MAG TPA: hypothetical protein VIM55_04100 [Mucilaginibacter sp.]
MQSIIEWCFGGLLFIWWICSIISQFNEKIRKVFGMGIFHLIPNYRFFAPVPIRRDFHLEYRIMDPSVGTTAWSRVRFFEERNMLSALWYPDKRMRKAFNTYVRRIIRILHSTNPKAVTKTTSYRHIANYIENSDQARNSNGFQFKIVSEQTFDKTAPRRQVLISEWHFPPKKESNEL